MANRDHAGGRERRREKWSLRMLPWMTGMVLGLTVFFFLASAAQLIYLHYQIMHAPEGDFRVPMQMLQTSQKAGDATQATNETLPAAAIAALTALERSAMERRYHQANISLLARVWTRYLGFVTGMVLAMVGAAFILGRLETTTSTASAETAAGKFNFQSDSPGLILAGLGVVLMITTIVTHHEINVQDRAIYAQGWAIGQQAPQQTQAATQGGAAGTPKSISVREDETTGSRAGSGGVAPSTELGEVEKRLREREGAGVTR